ncbi:p100 3L [African swine fever virus]|uniref:p100 3L n=1 Tax=African swine fever virus TaxID=10497 RepID=A0A894KS68_ASF|nr:p100 3L [African swine fever virus]
MLIFIVYYWVFVQILKRFTILFYRVLFFTIIIQCFPFIFQFCYVYCAVFQIFLYNIYIFIGCIVRMQKGTITHAIYHSFYFMVGFLRIQKTYFFIPRYLLFINLSRLFYIYFIANLTILYGFIILILLILYCHVRIWLVSSVMSVP